MPTVEEGGRGGYSLFPGGRRQDRRSQEKEVGARREQRQGGRGRRDQESAAESNMDWRAREPGFAQASNLKALGGANQHPKEVGANQGKQEGGRSWKQERSKPAPSFAEMLKQPGKQASKTGPQLRDEEISRMLDRKAAKAKKKRSKPDDTAKPPATRQTGPCLSKVVLNQISASTFGRIGRCFLLFLLPPLISCF